jgi:hypothetical protein
MHSLTDPGGAPIILPNSYGASTLTHGYYIHRAPVLFEMPPFMSMEMGGVASIDVGDNDMATTLTELTIGRGAAVSKSARRRACALGRAWRSFRY